MKTIIETATEAGKFTTLLSALKAAKMTDTLNVTGPFTLFAPSDEAFKKPRAGTVDLLLKDASKLKSVLGYHAVSGKHASKDIKAGDIKTVEGSALVVSVKDKDIKVNGAKVVQADMVASNGVIHMIDTVVMPKGTTLSKAA